MAERVEIEVAKLLKFLEKYKWIWDIKVTELFATNHIDTNMPTEWKTVMSQWTISDLHNFPIANDSYPVSLQEFIGECFSHSTLLHSVSDWEFKDTVHLPLDVSKGMKVKKQHEVSRLASVVNEVCKECNTRTVIDIGSGLGYLGDTLTRSCGVDVLGIERESVRAESALVKRHVRTISVDINESEECVDSINKLCESLGSNVGIIGLHCCGDLSPSLLHIFHSLHKVVSLLVLVPCCYHKRTSLKPVSKTVAAVLKEENMEYLSAYGFRLASENSFKNWQTQSWSDFNNHINHVAYRAIAQVIINNYAFLKPVSNDLCHKLRKADYKNFENFSKDFIKITEELLTDFKDQHTLYTSLHETHDKFSACFSLIEPFMGLQLCLKRSLQLLLVTDYFLYLKEKGIHCQLFNIFSESVSPHNIAIVAKH